MKLTKNQKKAKEIYDADQEYSLVDASKIVKDITFTKFDSSVDLDIRLGVDPRKADQMVRGIVALPNGTGKDQKVLVLCTPDKEEEAKAAGADFVGLDNLIKDIEGGWLDFDVMVTMPACMAKIGRLGRVLGPRGLMPNPKAGTVTPDVAKAVKEIKSGKIDFKVDKFGIIHASIGRSSFSQEQIKENAEELIQVISKLKPSSAKGTYFKSINLSSTMSTGVKIDKSSISDI
jgi:large subunit ribosomal protein L1